MYRYLTAKAADYTATVLDIPSQVSLPQTGDKNQVAHDFDDYSVAVVGLSSGSIFDIQLQWSYVSEANKDIIMDFWHNSSKADGRRRTFYWQHPTQNKTYTVRFTSPLMTEERPGNIMSVQTLSLRVEGNKP
jgi:hypothetical protein